MPASGTRDDVPARASDAPGESGPTGRRAQTRHRLIEAAHEVFIENGIRDASVELICQRAGFSRGAFYSNFETKEQLFLALFVEHAQGRTERLRRVIADTIYPANISDEVSLRESVQRVCELCAEPLVADQNWYMLLSEFRTQALRQPELRRHARAELNRLADDVGKVLLETLNDLGMELTIPVRDAVHTLGALAEAAIAQASFAELDSAADTSFMTEALPRLASTLVVPRTEVE